MFHYTYRISNIKESKHYYGCRTSKCNPKEDLGIKYFSSSKDKEFIKDQKKNPHNYKYKIIRIYNKRKYALQLEIKLHNKFDVGINESFYNRVKQTSSGWDTTGKAPYYDESGNVISISIKEAKERNLIAVSKGRKWSKEARESFCKIQKNRKPVTEETRKKQSEWQKGKPKWNELGRKKLSEIHKGKKLTDEWKQKIGIAQKGKEKEKIECIYCGYLCPKHLAKRWHFENCKHKSIM